MMSSGRINPYGQPLDDRPFVFYSVPSYKINCAAERNGVERYGCAHAWTGSRSISTSVA
ncbi:hypothetical protein HMPREF9413_3768 [Paenibacillus sp. HGF7]|nr:hypothetical protein HMPREF9413_3768 [Paenibacillus sp. HGF7]